ncbi:Oxysterol-binding protein [Penicillium canariense]|uniref:Oxysterol-binding protein n=1 Tax=Penicillium canariense TaxID=189055 RepID=A0A9W9HQ91_9EURO|nr:Oxysterol-binding protein [Penicillium canariense]KAJ5152899.1 Oxysterol-binding protein [Penicillium canariense]
MAAMEELEIHSKSYFVRWINVSANHTISWSIQPHKKSVNFGIFKHPGQSSLGSHLPASDSQSTDSTENLPATAANPGSRNQQSTVIEKLTAIGLKSIKWIGKCEADRISQGTYDVPASEGGNYALVFDNTFSKQISKTVTLVLLTYPTGLKPHGSAPPSIARSHTGGSSDSLPQPRTRRRENSKSTLNAQLSDSSGSSTVHSGVLQKRRRKRHQGWARRFFSLDFTSSTLSYYHDPNSSALRGAIPLSLAAVATNEKSREISIDSGTEIWHLRASNDQDFVAWKRALEKASSKDSSKEHELSVVEPSLLRLTTPASSSPAEEAEWKQVERLVSKVSGSRDAVRRLARDTDPKYLVSPIPSPMEPRGRDRGRDRSASPQPAASDAHSADSRRPFWKRKTSGNSQASAKRAPGPEHTNSSSSQLVVPSKDGAGKPASIASHADGMDEIHDHLIAVLRDLDNAVSEFSILIAGSKQRRHPPALTPRKSMESDVSQEFFDATDGGAASPLLTIQDSDEEDATADRAADAAENVEDDAPSDSDDETQSAALHDTSSASPLFPARPKSLAPLPLDKVRRRQNITAPTVMPPSLIGFLRKNVGKDLSTISMPVSANEPLSLLQRAAEILEYSSLLDQAAQASDPVERLMYVTAFAISSLSSNRVRERSIRKPFNPMLGETYELVREDQGFRFISEKVSHRPVQLAYQADSREWSLAQSPMPSQKFWGKSAEITTEGRVRITLHATGDRFSWTPATSFLRNIIAGEKYVEPVGELAVTNESTGHRSISTFKAGGMFSGRSEEVSTRAVDSYNKPVALGLVGTWPAALNLTRDGSPSGKPIWTAGPLVPNAPKHYGLTAFAAALNEITPIENSHLPPTDSRLRPDQRALEEGDLDRAEEIKVQLEEGQRARRREMEAAGESWTPRWFTRVSDDSDGEAAWRLKGGKDGYWDERAKGSWSGVVPVFEG